MIKNFLCCGEVVGGKGAWALLALRLVAGPAFIIHGSWKIQNAFAWMGTEASAPGWLQGLAAFAEFGGGIAILIGLLTQLAALGIAITMLTAIFMIHLPKGDPFIGHNGSWELPGVYLAIMVALMLRGAGAISLDAVFFKKKDY